MGFQRVRRDWETELNETETFPSPGEFLCPGIEPRFPKLQADSLPAEPQIMSTLNIKQNKKFIFILFFP